MFDGTGCRSCICDTTDDWVHLTEPTVMKCHVHLACPVVTNPSLKKIPKSKSPIGHCVCSRVVSIIDAVRRAPEPGTSDWTAVVDALANPLIGLPNTPKGVACHKVVSVSHFLMGCEQNPICPSTTTPVTIPRGLCFSEPPSRMRTHLRYLATRRFLRIWRNA